MSTVIDAHAHLEWYYKGGMMKLGGVDDLARIAKKLGEYKFCVSSITGINYDFVEGNNDVINAMEKYPDTILGYAVVNPRFGDLALEEIDRCVVKKGMVGVKMYPVKPRFRADEPSMDPVMEKIAKLKVPSLIHSDDMSRLHNLADRFPDAVIIQAHMGGCEDGDLLRAIYGARRFDNLYLDTCTSHIEANMIEEAVRVVGADRVLYGSDYPVLDLYTQIAKVKYAMVREEEKRMILVENMMRILKGRRIT